MRQALTVLLVRINAQDQRLTHDLPGKLLHRRAYLLRGHGWRHQRRRHLDSISTGERRTHLRQLLQHRLRRRQHHRRVSPHTTHPRRNIEALRAHIRTPLRPQLLITRAGLLVLTSRFLRLRQLRRAHPRIRPRQVLISPRADLVVPLRPRLDVLTTDLLQIGLTRRRVHVLPGHPQPLRQLRTQRRLIDRPASLQLVQQALPVQAAHAAPVSTNLPVVDQHMRVQVRITRTARAVLIRDPTQPQRADQVLLTRHRVVHPRVPRMLTQIPERRPDRRLMRGHDLLVHHRIITQPPQHRHALRRRRRHVVAVHAALRVRPPQRRPRRRDRLVEPRPNHQPIEHLTIAHPQIRLHLRALPVPAPHHEHPRRSIPRLAVVVRHVRTRDTRTLSHRRLVVVRAARA